MVLNSVRVSASLFYVSINVVKWALHIVLALLFLTVTLAYVGVEYSCGGGS